MVENTIKMTDTELLKKLRESYIDAAQKQEFETLLPEMNDEEKTTLLNLIERSALKFEETQKEYQEGLKKIGAEYSEAVEKEDKKFRQEFEELGKKEDSEALKEVEVEIDDAPAKGTSKKEEDHTSKKKHGARNLILLLTILVLVALGILFALSHL